MNFKSIKFRLVLLTVLGLIILGISISLIAVNKSSTALLQARGEQLSSIAASKVESLNEYTNFFKGLINATASDINTVENLWYFNDGFEALEDETDLDITQVEKELIAHYNANYLNKINFQYPNIAPKKDAKEYLPLSNNERISQNLYILEN